jgi:hypothetical protein
MAKSKKNRSSGRSRRQNRNGNSSASSYEASVVKRELQLQSNLIIPTGDSDAIGWINWNGPLTSNEATEMSKVYRQFRVTRVCVRVAPIAFNGTTTGQYYSSVLGSMCHDATGTTFSSMPNSYADLTMLPRSKLWVSSGMGNQSWKSMTYKAPLSKVQILDVASVNPSAGYWCAVDSRGNMIGRTYFAASTADAATAASNQQVLSVLLQMSVEFREPVPDSTDPFRTTFKPMEYYPREQKGELYPKSPTVLKSAAVKPLQVNLDPVTEEKDDMVVVVERKEQPRARSMPPARAR